MIPAVLDTVAIDLLAGKDHVFRANGSVVRIPGFMSVYQEDTDDSKSEEGEEKLLPPLKEGQKVELKSITGEQHFTEPPPRYTEASLVKALEEHDIGRPSTYASIIATLKNREYVVVDNKRFKPTDVARVVSHFLTEYFSQYVDYDFTARLEDELDNVARGEKAWIPLLKEFWVPFKERIATIGETVQRSDVTQEKIDEACPKCAQPLSIRLGRRGRFIGCTAYPGCDYTRNLNSEDSEQEAEIVKDRHCPECQGPLVVKHGKYGKFIGCGNYPDCKHIEPLEKPMDTAVVCPKCKKGTILKRKSRRGKVFYSCSEYPGCDYAIWDEPVNESCPTCHWPILTIKVTKKHGRTKLCPQKDCSYSLPLE